jgi:hypothetical protein
LLPRTETDGVHFSRAWARFRAWSLPAAEARRDQAGVEGVDEGGGPIAQVKLGQYVTEVGFDGRLADEQL